MAIQIGNEKQGKGFKQPNLYRFWGTTIADNLFDEDQILINLASKEYSRNVTPYVKNGRQMITVDFQETKNGQWKTVGVHAKMARGEMVRYIAENQLNEPEQLQDFHDFGFVFEPKVSTDNTYVFRTKFDFKRR